MAQFSIKLWRNFQLLSTRYLLEDAKFRLYYTSQCDEAQNLIVVVENNWGDLVEMELDFNHAGEESEDDTESSQPDKEGGA